MSRAWSPTRTVVPALWLLLACSSATAPAAPGAVNAQILRQHVEALASDRLEGRETGTEGCRLAEEYIRDSFRSSALQAYPGTDDYFADFELQNRGFDLDTSQLSIEHGDDTWQAEPGADYRPFPFSGQGDLVAPVVFAGYGITAEEHAWDDYAGLDVDGKIVLVLRYEPGKDDADSVFDGTRNSPYAYFTAKERNAREHGAVGMLLVQGALHGDDPDNLPFPRGLSLKSAQDESDVSIPSLQIRRGWLKRTLRGSDTDLRRLQEQIEAGRRPAELPPLDLQASLHLERSDAETTPARNVVAFVPGADPLLSPELIVVGAHHDHVGLGTSGSDRIFNGADDNASGTALLLELARVWKQRQPAAPRSVVFVTFTAEEKGLLGSRALVQSDLLPMDQVRFMINLDMVGRNADRPIEVLDDPRARGLRDLVERANDAVNLPLSFDNGRLPGNSDHASFRDEDVPVLFFFTGTHDDYHRPGDHADKLDYERMADIGTLSLALLEELATLPQNEFPGLQQVVHWLGAELSIEGTPSGVQGVFTAIKEASVASHAGLQAGDVLTALGNDSLRGSRHAGSRLQNVEVDQTLSLTVERDGVSQVLEVKRPRPGFLGIAYAALSAQERQRLGIAAGEGVVVQQVLPEGPAADAGLQVGDIILRLADEPAYERDLASRLQAVGARNTVEMQILRDGETLQRKVRLSEVPPTG